MKRLAVLLSVVLLSSSAFLGASEVKASEAKPIASPKRKSGRSPASIAKTERHGRRDPEPHPFTDHVRSRSFRPNDVEKDKTIAIRLLKETENLSVSDSILKISESLQGTPYGGGFLGEGASSVRNEVTTPEIDSDPLYRFDRFDCTTFVETTLSLASAHDYASFLRLQDEIRYANGGKSVSYVSRNHFTEQSWNRENQARGVIEDATTDVYRRAFGESSSRKPRTFRGMIHLPRFLSVNLHAALDGFFEQNATIEPIPFTHHPKPSGTRESAIRESLTAFDSSANCNGVGREGECFPVSIEALTISDLWKLKPEGDPDRQEDYVLETRLLDAIPTPAVLNIVRENYWLPSIDSTMLVSHQGLAIRKPGDSTVYFRHASSGAARQVSENPIADYLFSFRNDPQIRGINIQKVLTTSKKGTLY